MDIREELFQERDLEEYLEHRKKDLLNTIHTLKVQNYNDYYSLSGDFVSKNKIEPLLLQENNITLISKADDYSSKHSHILVKFFIPFVGASFLLNCIPSEKPIKTAPAGVIKQNKLEIAFRINIGLQGEFSKKRLRDILDALNLHINAINRQVHQYNKWVENEVPLLVKQRYEYVQKVQEALDSFGVSSFENS